jgi:hypothetical protein
VDLQAKRVLLAVEGKDAGVWDRFAEEMGKHNGHPKAISQARHRFESWCCWVRTEAKALTFGLLEPMRQAADMVERHLEGILAHWRRGLKTAFLEGLNSSFSEVKRKARGYRSTEYQTAISTSSPVSSRSLAIPNYLLQMSKNPFCCQPTSAIFSALTRMDSLLTHTNNHLLGLMPLVPVEKLCRLVKSVPTMSFWSSAKHHKSITLQLFIHTVH